MVDIGERSHNIFLTDQKDSKNHFWRPSNLRARGTIVCESIVSGICRAAVRLCAHQVRPWPETAKSKNVRCCPELHKLCLHAACHDQRLAASESMLVAQTVFDATLRWSVRMPPSRDEHGDSLEEACCPLVPLDWAVCPPLLSRFDLSQVSVVRQSVVRRSAVAR